MRSAISAVIVLLVAASAVHAEICVKHHTHTDEYYYGGTTTPAVDRDFELWFGDGRLALVEEDTKMIFDVVDSTMMFISFPDSIYLVTSIPLQWGNILTEEDAGRVQMYQYTGEMKDLGKNMDIGGRSCEGRMLTTWIPYEDIKYNETDDITWYTKDVTFDMDLYGKVFPCFMALRNYDPGLIRDLSGSEGFPMRREQTRFQKGIEIKTVTTVEDISEKKTAEGFWEAPAGFTETDRITLRQLQGN